MNQWKKKVFLESLYWLIMLAYSLLFYTYHSYLFYRTPQFIPPVFPYFIMGMIYAMLVQVIPYFFLIDKGSKCFFKNYLLFIPILVLVPLIGDYFFGIMLKDFYSGGGFNNLFELPKYFEYLKNL